MTTQIDINVTVDNLTIESLVAILTSELTALQERLDLRTGVLASHNTVVQSSAGLYLKRIEGGYIPMGLKFASIWEEQDAATIVRNVPGTTAVSYIVALRSEIQEIKNQIESIKAMTA